MKQKWNSLNFCLVAIGLLTGCGSLFPADASLEATAAPASTLIQTESYTGAIFTASETEKYFNWVDGPVDSTWTPTSDDVAKLEEGLADYLIEHNGYNMYETHPVVERLSKYSRQYFGIVQADEPLIFANFFCGELDNERREFYVIVADGGDCYFHVVYDVAADKFTYLRINGES